MRQIQIQGTFYLPSVSDVLPKSGIPIARIGGFNNNSHHPSLPDEYRVPPLQAILNQLGVAFNDDDFLYLASGTVTPLNINGMGFTFKPDRLRSYSAVREAPAGRFLPSFDNVPIGSTTPPSNSFPWFQPQTTTSGSSAGSLRIPIQDEALVKKLGLLVPLTSGFTSRWGNEINHDEVRDVLFLTQAMPSLAYAFWTYDPDEGCLILEAHTGLVSSSVNKVRRERHMFNTSLSYSHNCQLVTALNNLGSQATCPTTPAIDTPDLLDVVTTPIPAELINQMMAITDPLIAIADGLRFIHQGTPAAITTKAAWDALYT